VGIAVALWIAVPLAAIHLLVRRRRAVLVFQVLIDAMLLVLPVRVLLSGAHLGPGFAGGEAWGAPVTISGSAEQSDLPLQFAVWWEEVRRLVASGEPPWISDRIGGGTPLFAHGQSGLPFPLQAPVWALGAERGTDVMAVWKLELAALGTFLLLRRLRLRSAAAATGALTYAFGLYTLSWLVVPLAWVVAATPWVWWTLIGCLRGRKAEAAGLALLLGALAGWSVHPESAAFLWMAIAVSGTVLAWLDGVPAGGTAKPVTLDLHEPFRTMLRTFSLEPVDLSPGEHTLILEYKGARDGIARPEVGLDFVWVQKLVERP